MKKSIKNNQVQYTKDLLDQYEKKLNIDSAQMNSAENEELRTVLQNARKNNPVAHPDAIKLINRLSNQKTSAPNTSQKLVDIVLNLQSYCRNEDLPDFARKKVSLIAGKLNETDERIFTNKKNKLKTEIIQLLNELKNSFSNRPESKFLKQINDLLQLITTK